jgi:hypothetical protein
MIYHLFLVSLLLSSVKALHLYSREIVLKPFLEKNALKIISGLNNFNIDLIQNVVSAASNAGASHVDIACDPNLVRIAKEIGNIPVCVSSIIPKDFVAAVEAGADMIEIGNFDGFYENGIKFTSKDIISMTKETRALLPNIPLSVTIPHTLSLAEQIELAKELEICGVDIIQTEGKMGVDPASMGVQELIEKAAPALASAYALSRAVRTPIMCSSGLTDVTVSMALASGASGVGVGSMVNRLPSYQQMFLAVQALAQAMGRTPTASTTTDNGVNMPAVQSRIHAIASNKISL